MNTLLKQFKKRRLNLGLKQSDMMLRAGISRQQYQRLESKGNPRLETLELIAKGLNSEIMLIPKDKLNAVLAVLESPPATSLKTDTLDSYNKISESEPDLSDDPWQDLLGDDS